MWSAEAAPPLSHSREYESGGAASALHTYQYVVVTSHGPFTTA